MGKEKDVFLPSLFLACQLMTVTTLYLLADTCKVPHTPQKLLPHFKKKKKKEIQSQYESSLILTLYPDIEILCST